MARPPAADGEDLQIWRAAMNVLNIHLWTAYKGWCSSLGVGWRLTIPHCKKPACHVMLYRALDLDIFFGMT
jgi:hypothetical protein